MESLFDINLERYQLLFPLQQLQKEVTVRFDELSERSLREVCASGCRILVINQRVTNEKKQLCIEQNGKMVWLKNLKLKSILSEQSKLGLIEAVFLNMPSGGKVKKVFQDLGIPSVFFSETILPHQEDSAQEFVAIPPKDFREITHLAADTIKGLLSEKSILESVEAAKACGLVRSEEGVEFHFTCKEPDYKLFDCSSSDARKQLKQGNLSNLSQLFVNDF
mmetsp:Transcript_4743/g.7152  ORF Transcript_4743/g.7152 Transcript_4743/m.7152 type:complete len:221 (-) Transcript_4743:1961-2623(-)